MPPQAFIVKCVQRSPVGWSAEAGSSAGPQICLLSSDLGSALDEIIYCFAVNAESMKFNTSLEVFHSIEVSPLLYLYD